MAGLQPGDVLGDYEILRRLGAGAAGSVFQVRHRPTGVERALKVTHSTLPLEDIPRLEREGQALARLDHPHLLRVHAFGTQGGQNFLALELATGGTLKENLASRPNGSMPLSEALERLRELTGALEAAHAAGVVHRDLKPDNVLFTGDGVLKIADFGLASLSDRSRLTETGVVMGTPIYMAPEQANGAEVSTPADIYGLAATFYAMLTGRPPITAGSSLWGTLAKIQTEVPARLDKVLPEVPAQLASLIADMLAKEPDQRPGAREVLERLEADSGSAPAKGWVARFVIAALGCLLLGLLFFVSTKADPQPRTRDPERGKVQPDRQSQSPSSAEPHRVPTEVWVESALEEYLEARPSPALRQAFLNSKSLKTSPADARETYASATALRSARARFALARSGYVGWATLALEEAPQTEELRSVLEALATFGSPLACQRLAKWEPTRTDRDWKVLKHVLRAHNRYDPKAARKETPNLWSRCWSRYGPSPSGRDWRGARDSLSSNPQKALEAYLRALERAPVQFRDRVAVELWRVCEWHVLTTLSVSPETASEDLERTLKVTMWPGGLLLRARLVWLNHETEPPTGPAGLRMFVALKEAAATGPDQYVPQLLLGNYYAHTGNLPATKRALAPSYYAPGLHKKVECRLYGVAAQVYSRGLSRHAAPGWAKAALEAAEQMTQRAESADRQVVEQVLQVARAARLEAGMRADPRLEPPKDR